MTIWVDADACPVEIRAILFRAAKRCGMRVVLVANSPLPVPEGEIFESVVVPPGADEADNRIAESCAPGDLVITADVPLAARVVEKGATGLNPRGEFYTEENVKSQLSMRNFMEEMRFGGLVSGGPRSHDKTHNAAFANALDRFLARQGDGGGGKDPSAP